MSGYAVTDVSENESSDGLEVLPSANGGFPTVVSRMLQRMKSGDLGAIPVIVGLMLIWTIFTVLNHRFLSSENLSNLALQMAPVGTMAVGIVLVLLLGEIDLSAGSVSGLCGAVLAVAHVKHGLTPILAIVITLTVAALIGFFQGSIIERLRIPSFVVTLAGLIGWQGLQLWVLGKQGTINFSFTGSIAKLNSTFLPKWFGIVIALFIPAVSGARSWLSAASRRRRGLPASPLQEVLARPIVIAVLLVGTALVLNANRGVPLTLAIFGIVVTAIDTMLTRTVFGRHIYATGGNKEAARRAGIPVKRVRTIVFMAASTLAAFAGVLAASRLAAVNQSSGGSDTLLSAIAAAVIGGTSLFGGKGRAYAALLGALIIVSITNGMFLLNLDSSVRFMITGAVLLVAVVVEAASRRNESTPRR
jgi:D-xylose transport system permease protein